MIGSSDSNIVKLVHRHFCRSSPYLNLDVALIYVLPVRISLIKTIVHWQCCPGCQDCLDCLSLAAISRIPAAPPVPGRTR